MKNQGVFLILFFSCLFLPWQGFTAEKINFQTYDNGLKLAEELNKKIFLYFHADWCKYCAKMEKETFSDDKIREYFHDNFISIKVDADIEKTIASKYNVRGLPILFFLKEDGSKLSYRPGYVDAKELLYMLKYVNTQSYEQMSFPEFLKKN